MDAIKEWVTRVVPGAYLDGDYSFASSSQDDFDVIDPRTGKVVASGHTPAKAWKAAKVALEAAQKPTELPHCNGCADTMVNPAGADGHTHSWGTVEHPEPSPADLDAVAEEVRAKEATEARQTCGAFYRDTADACVRPAGHYPGSSHATTIEDVRTSRDGLFWWELAGNTLPFQKPPQLPAQYEYMTDQHAMALRSHLFKEPPQPSAERVSDYEGLPPWKYNAMELHEVYEALHKTPLDPTSSWQFELARERLRVRDREIQYLKLRSEIWELRKDRNIWRDRAEDAAKLYSGLVIENADKALAKASSIDALKQRAEVAERERDELRSRLDDALNANERDRSVVYIAITALDKELAGRDWLRESRGSYEWDDDRWHAEFSAACEAISLSVEPLRKMKNDLTNCPTTTAEAKVIRGLVERAEKAERELAQVKAARVEGFEEWWQEWRPPYRNLHDAAQGVWTASALTTEARTKEQQRAAVSGLDAWARSTGRCNGLSYLWRDIAAAWAAATEAAEGRVREVLSGDQRKAIHLLATEETCAEADADGVDIPECDVCRAILASRAILALLPAPAKEGEPHAEA